MRITPILFLAQLTGCGEVSKEKDSGAKELSSTSHDGIPVTKVASREPDLARDTIAGPLSDTGEECNNNQFFPDCRDGFLTFCNQFNRIGRIPSGEIPNNNFCIDGYKKTCASEGWRVVTEEERENPFLWKSCGETVAEENPPSESTETAEPLPQPATKAPEEPDSDSHDNEEPLGEAPPFDCNGLHEGDYFCHKEDGFLKICTQFEWKRIADCRGADICDTEEGNCYDIIETEICTDLETVVLNSENRGEDVGQWVSTTLDTTEDPVCLLRNVSGFPIHNNRLRDIDVVTTALFAVTPNAHRLRISISVEGMVQDLHVHVDNLDNRVGFLSRCVPIGLTLDNDSLRIAPGSDQTIVEDGFVRVAISGTKSPDEPIFIPSSITLTDCHMEERRVPRERIEQEN